eukprot:CAMPEP_0169077988 /NCGR_PEP_ID=MMETSP1015-20121227/9173_1 /TAXON_ID=342587 /ORGANISM="Karlodinium micrum, Strain CCMP2283" /LENGTH=539 /DNA_ID=CAMNT_0009137551 /DNA_START=42 /DNA_END=1661 /DNA_ORIENTATION=-
MSAPTDFDATIVSDSTALGEKWKHHQAGIDDTEDIDSNELSWTSASTQTPYSVSPSRCSSEADEDMDELKTTSLKRDWTFKTPTVLGHPDGSSGGFYELMQRVREIRISIANDFIDDYMDYSEASTSSLKEAMASLRSIPRPLGWTVDDDDNDLHVLATDTQMLLTMNLAYEKNELSRDLLFLQGGDVQVLESMRLHHTKVLNAGMAWVESQYPSWEDSLNRAVHVMQVVAATSFARTPFRNLITDRDGTVNNYCDRYASSQQSLYNAVWISNFSRQCTEHLIFVTAAPLGGRLDAPGLVELCTMPPGLVRYSGSKGREYYDHDQKRVVEIEPLPKNVEEALDSLYRKLVLLCGEARNRLFLVLGSGLQRKCGEITIARNDPSQSVSDSESRRFMTEVQQAISEIDPGGIMFGMNNTGTDIEIFPRMKDGQPLFDKGNGVASLNAQLDLGIAVGPNLVCGDTPSDLRMIEATLDLMPNRPATNLGVLFVITAEQHERTPRLADQVRSLCSANGTPYAILPSSDVLVAALAVYTKTMCTK